MQTHRNFFRLVAISSISLSSSFIDDLPLTPSELAESDSNNDDFKEDDIFEMNTLIYNTDGFNYDLLDL